MGKLIAHTKLRKVGRQVLNQVGPHVFITDEPLSLHGTDAGPIQCSIYSARWGLVWLSVPKVSLNMIPTLSLVFLM